MTAAVAWTLITLYVLSMLTTIGSVGKPRKPLQPAAAVISTFLGALMVVGIAYLAWWSA